VGAKVVALQSPLSVSPQRLVFRDEIDVDSVALTAEMTNCGWKNGAETIRGS
jgi:hypothetical protein